MNRCFVSSVIFAIAALGPIQSFAQSGLDTTRPIFGSGADDGNAIVLPVIPKGVGCPRVELFAITPRFTAVTVNNFTVGHLVGASLVDRFEGVGSLERGGFAVQWAPHSGPFGKPVVDCIPEMNVTFDAAKRVLSVNGDAITTFQTYSPTRQVLDAWDADAEFTPKPGVTIFQDRIGMVAAVKSGPDRVQPSDTGGAGKDPLIYKGPMPKVAK